MVRVNEQNVLNEKEYKWIETTWAKVNPVTSFDKIGCFRNHFVDFQKTLPFSLIKN